MSDEWKGEEPEGSSWKYIHSWLGMKPETPEEKAAREIRESQKRAANELAVEHVSDLPPFMEKPECPKCGCNKLTWRFGQYKTAPVSDDHIFGRVGFNPYIALGCRRCGYGKTDIWADTPLWVMSPKTC